MSRHRDGRHSIVHLAAVGLEDTFRALGASEWACRLGLQPRRVRVSAHRVMTESLSAGLSLRLVFVSDFHVGGVTSNALLEAACDSIEALHPDILLLGGDFVSTRSGDAHAIAARLGAIKPPYGTFGVLGNHDYYAGADHVAAILEHSGIELLRNRNTRLSGPFSGLWLCGFDDHHEGTPNHLDTFAGADGYRIVLMHSPEGVRNLINRRYDLALCGHTHGGQIALPGGRAILLPKGKFVRAYSAGEYKMDGPDSGTLIVSRGVGCNLLPVRIFSPAEIVLCEITGTGEDPPRTV